MTSRSSAKSSTSARAAKPAKKAAPKGKHGGARPNTGGARPGAGRKQSRLPAAILDRIGPVPTDPLEQQEWYTVAIGVVQWEVMQGRPYGTMLEQLQRSAKVAASMIPEAIKARAARLLKRNEDERERDASAAPGDEPVERREDAPPRNRPLRRDPA